MTTITAPLATITLQARVPDVVRSCIVQQPSPPPDPGEEPPAPVTGPDIYTPVAPGVTYASLPTVTIVDTGPDQMIGCIIDTADNPQGRLNALFPTAVDGDGVIERSTNDIWVFDGTTWENVGPTPGPTIVTATVIPPWNEIEVVEAVVRTRLAVEAFPYALTPILTSVPAYGSTIGLLVQSSRALVRVPATGVVVTAETPTINGGVSVIVPAVILQIDTIAPSLPLATGIMIPAASATISGITPDLVGRRRTQVSVPTIDVNVIGHGPTIAASALIAVPAIEVTLTGVAPAVRTGEPDPDFSNVSLLLHMDDSNGSTTFADSSSNAIAVTGYGNTQISTAQSKFGTSSAYLDGFGDYLMTASSLAPLQMGTGDFTVEAFIRPEAVNGYRGIIGLGLGDFNTLYILNGQLVWYSSGVVAGTIAVNTWHHVAASRQGTSLRVFLDGTLVNTSINSTDLTLGRLRVGSNGANTGEFFQGWIDELRVTKGVARYTANFTPPTAPFPDF